MNAKRFISTVTVAAALLIGTQAQAAEDQTSSPTKASVSVSVSSVTTAVTPASIRFSPEFELAFLDLYTSADDYEAPDLSCERGCVLEYNACMWDYGMSCDASLDMCSATCE